MVRIAVSPAQRHARLRAPPQEIVKAHRPTGNFDHLLKLVLPTVEYYDTVYKRLTHRLELFDVAAYISMETPKLETAVPLAHAP